MPEDLVFYYLRRVGLGLLILVVSTMVGFGEPAAAEMPTDSAPGPYEIHFPSGVLPATSDTVGEAAQSLSGTTLHVPADHSSIQAAIDAAVDGDTDRKSVV